MQLMSKHVLNLSGKVLHGWKVLEFKGYDERHRSLWECECEFGHKQIVRSAQLNCKKKQMCCKTCHAIVPNTKFGKLKVLIETIGLDNRKMCWCQCDCGNKICIRSAYLSSTRRGIQSCGCKHKEKRRKIEGLVIGRLTVLKRLEGKFTGVHAHYLCQCQCGKKVEILGTNLINRKNRLASRSCGCLLSDTTHFSCSTKDIKGWARYIKKMSEYKCIKCGLQAKYCMTAHHIKPVATHPELSLDPNNGVCMCWNCHKAMHNIFMKTILGQTELSEFIESDIDYLCKKYGYNNTIKKIPKDIKIRLNGVIINE